mmetsp:Transcript_126356/g.252495  ORF Transcript_126356/g.252495 Transcript_126356/m.252495 type:complete len:208 (+) Transcript_126356:3015-3638(+)
MNSANAPKIREAVIDCALSNKTTYPRSVTANATIGVRRVMSWVTMKIRFSRRAQCNSPFLSVNMRSKNFFSHAKNLTVRMPVSISTQSRIRTSDAARCRDLKCCNLVVRTFAVGPAPATMKMPSRDPNPTTFTSKRLATNTCSGTDHNWCSIGSVSSILWASLPTRFTKCPDDGRSCASTRSACLNTAAIILERKRCPAWKDRWSCQ